MKTIIFASVMLALLLFPPAPARAQEMQGPQGPSFETTMNPALLEEVQVELGITDEQIAAVKELVFTRQREAIRLRAAVQVAELDLRHALDADKPNRESVMKILGDLEELRTKLDRSNVEMVLKLKEIIKPEQQKKLRDLMKKKAREQRQGPGRERARERRETKEGGSPSGAPPSGAPDEPPPPQGEPDRQPDAR